MKESIILKYIWLLSGNFMIAILLAACNGSNIIPDNPDEEIEIIPERSITFSLGTGYACSACHSIAWRELWCEGLYTG